MLIIITYMGKLQQCNCLASTVKFKKNCPSSSILDDWTAFLLKLCIGFELAALLFI